MREIIYLQAGNFSNFAGTHFWNTQESYLGGDLGQPDDSEGDGAKVDHAISFCESSIRKAESTTCPRVILMDKKCMSNPTSQPARNAINLGEANFGAIETTERVVEMDDVANTWNGGLIEYRQDLIGKSDYQLRMEAESEDSLELLWTPSIQNHHNLPETDWEQKTHNWVEGQEMFSTFNESADLMDGTLRMFVEDCDNMQGVQLMNDTDTFGGFMASFFADFRDEYLKVPSLTFPILSSKISAKAWMAQNDMDTRKVLNEALYLRTLNDLSTLNVPIGEPGHWSSLPWEPPLGWPRDSQYHQSAMLSAHVETATLPMRTNYRDMASICGQLKWRGATSFGELGGILPTTGIPISNEALIKFSSEVSTKSQDLYARIDVTRGFSARELGFYKDWSSKHQSPVGSHITSFHSSAYPLPSSFPSIQDVAQGSAQYSNPDFHENLWKQHSVGAFSYLSSSSNTSLFVDGYARTVDACVNRRTSSVLTFGLSLDDLKELANDLWTIHDNASEATQILHM